MKNSIPETLRRCDGHAEWFAEVMTVVKAYGAARAELAVTTGLVSSDCLTVENYEKVSPLLHECMMPMAHLRDLIGGTISGIKK